MGLLDGLQGLLSGNATATPPAPYYADPRVMLLSSLAQAAGQQAGTTRTPTSNGAMLGNIGGAVGPGMLAGNQAAQQNLQEQMGQYGLYSAGLRNNLIQGLLGGNAQAPGQQTAQAAPPQAPPPPQAAAGTPAPAPPMGQPPASAQPPAMGAPGPQAQAPAAPMGLLSGNASTGGMPGGASLGQALISDVLFPGSGKDVYAKQFPGPTDAERALSAAGIDPKSPQGRNLLNLAALKDTGIKSVLGGERAGVPIQQFNPATGRYEMDPNSLNTMTQGAMTQVPAKEAEAAFSAGLRVNTENEIEKRKAFYTTGQMPPDYAQPNKTAPTVAAPNGDVATPNGTVVPAPPKINAFMGTDALNKQNTNTQEAEKNFGAMRQGLPGTESRMVGLAKALQIVEGKGLNEGRAEIANTLRGAGLAGLADTVMSAKDTAAVQTAIGLQTLDVLGQLKQINSGTGGRILNSEFVNLLEKQYGPNMSPQANFDLLKQALGGVMQTRNMIDDYYKVAKPAGWRDANGFISSWYSDSHNSMDEMENRAAQAMGPLRGMANAVPPDLPMGTTQIGTYQGKPVYQLPDGSKKMAQ